MCYAGPFVEKLLGRWWIWDSPGVHRLGPFPTKQAAEESRPIVHLGKYPRKYKVGWLFGRPKSRNSHHRALLKSS